MLYNRIAIYGHRGWASSAITQALLTTRAPAKLLYRPGSNANGLKGDFDEVEVDIQYQDALRAALKDVDILMYSRSPLLTNPNPNLQLSSI
jgi:nucleoside-diphosphate-sugar epimerase